MGIIFSRYVSKGVYGNYQLVLSFIATLTIFSLPGFSKGIWSETTTGKDGALDVAINKKMKWGILGSIALIAIGIKYYIVDDQYILMLCLIVGAITFPLFAGGNIWVGFLDSKKKYNLSTRLSLIFETLNKLAIVAALFIFRESLLMLIIAATGSIAVTNYIGLKIAEKNKSNDLVTDDFSKYGFFLTKISIFKVLMSKIDKLLIGIFIGPIELAIYSFSLIIPDQVMALVASVTSVIIPKIGEHSQKKVQEKIYKKAALIIIGNLILVTIVIFLTPWVITTLFTEKYAESILYSQIITAGIFLYVFEVIFANILLVKKHKNQILKVNLLNPAFRSIAIIIGFVWYGILGVAIATIITRFFSFAVHLYFTRQSNRV